MNRLENEDFLDYCDRLISGKESKLYDIENTEIWKLIFDEDISADEARKRLYGVKKLILILKNEGFKNITGSDMLKKIESEKQELIKEKIKVQTEKSTLMQALREQSRFELFIEQSIDAINKINPININNRVVEKYNNNDNKSGLLLFADAHYGKELLIKGLYGEILNKYDIETFENRMWSLLNQTVEICKKENFKSISIFNLGDELEGILRIGQLMSLKTGLVDSTIAFSYFLATWLNELSKYVDIEYYSTSGNHTDLRLLTGKKGDFPTENMSKIINVLIKEILKDNKNVTIHDNNTDKIFINIQGYNILGLHGEEKSIMQSIRDFSFIYDTKIDYLCSGHKHHANSISAGIKKGCIGTGSIIGIDDYSMELKKTSDASSTFCVFEKGKGKTIEYNLILE